MSRTGSFVVTGCGSGIGRAIALNLVANGHLVFGLGRNVEKLRATAQLAGPRFAFASADLALAAPTLTAAGKIREWLADGHLPLLGLVNNAGVVDRLGFQETSDEIWERHFHSNLLSAVRLTRELYPELLAGKPSSVLNISSTLALRPIAKTSAYSALKAAMVNWSQTLALEWAAHGIRVNCICPGIVDTPIHGLREDDPARAHLGDSTPLGRAGQPEDIAEASAFLLASSWSTGTVLTIDGGISL